MGENAMFAEFVRCSFPARTVSLTAVLPSFPLAATEKPQGGHRAGAAYGSVHFVCVQHLLCGPPSPSPLLLG